MKRSWLWPLVVFVSIIVVIFFTFILPGTPVQGPALLWFVVLCPGISFVPLIKLEHFLIEVTLSIAFGLAIDGIVVIIFLYAKYWSPPAMLCVLIILSLMGSILQFPPGEKLINRLGTMGKM